MHDLPTYYLLPLVGLNFKKFGVCNSKSNLKSTKIDLKQLKLICEVKILERVDSSVYQVGSYAGNFENSIIYDFPGSLVKTLDAFTEGKYSKIPTSIKDYIVKHSGLPKNHDVLLALNKDYKLKLKLEKALDESLDEEAELLSIPNEEWFIA